MRRMAIILAVITGSIVLINFLSCGKSPVIVRKDTFRFNYMPYNGIADRDPFLYNYMFNIIRNKLVYYVRKTLPSAPENLGMVLELDGANKTVFDDIMRGAVLRGWLIFETDTIPMPESEVEDYNSGSLDRKLVQTPKASFTIVRSGDHATAYVKYWVLQYWNYNFVHYLVKTTNWSVIRTDVLE